MTVIVLSTCPKKIRGNISKWLLEVSINVFVGKINARVREALWQDICENMPKSGRATMVFNTTGEQGIGVEILGESWVPVDFEGIFMIRHPLPNSHIMEETNEYVSKVRIMKKAEYKNSKQNEKVYCAVDIETTGLKPTDEIIEIGAVKFTRNTVIDKLHIFVKTDKTVPTKVQEITKITPHLLQENGCSLKEAISQLMDFIKDHALVFHNSSFDMNMLRKACVKTNVTFIKNKYYDTLTMSRKKLEDAPSYRLKDLCLYLGIKYDQMHQASNDSEVTRQLFLKLLEIDDD